MSRISNIAYLTIKACQSLLEPNAVTAQLRLARYDIKRISRIFFILPGDLRTNNLGDFLAVRYTTYM
jgi:hypothetical protein